MSIDREFWLKPFVKNHFPNWNCPKCGNGILRPIKNTFSFDESGDITIERNKHGEYFEPDSYTYRYSLLLKCNNHDCQERVSSCGYGHVVEEYDAMAHDGEYVEVFMPEYFYPQLNIFIIPNKCPESVSKEIRTSFKLFFSDPAASANYVRKTVESILTDKGVKRYSLSKGKRKIINLHNRILDFEKIKPKVAKRLLAIKWLGNEGSHSSNITKNDVLDAYEILELILDDLYIGYRNSVEKKVEKINKSKKPLHPSS